MKALAAAILTILVLVQSFSQWVIMAEYVMNKDFIAQNLCVNRSRPQLHCHGKCQMMKKLAEEEKDNSAGSSKLVSKIKLPEVFFSTIYTVLLPPAQTAVPKNKEYYQLSIYSAPLSPVFHPPAA